MVLVDCLRAAGFPDGAVNLVVGATGDTSAPIMADPRVRKVYLTGSTRVGQQMIRGTAETVKKVSMELGGNAPLIVYDDVDLDAALDVSVPTKFANCGQVCVAPDRFFIHESLHDRFVEGFVERARQIKLGDGLDPDVGMGPLINGGSLETIDTIVQAAMLEGATLALGGKRAAGFNEGHFYEPTVLTQVMDDMKVFGEKNFGPVAAITSFADDDEVLERANSSTMGLVGLCLHVLTGRGAPRGRDLEVRDGGHQKFRSGCQRGPFSWHEFLRSGPRRRQRGDGRLSRHQTRTDRFLRRRDDHQQRQEIVVRGQAGAAWLAVHRQPVHRRDHGSPGL